MTRGPSAGARLCAPVVTGLGAVTPFGWGVEPLMDALMQDRSAFRPLSVLDPRGHRTQLAGEVPAAPQEVEARVFGDLSPRHRARLARTDRFALAAAAEALGQAGLDRAAIGALGPRVGLFFGSSTGAMFEGEHFYAALRDDPGTRHSIAPIATQQLNGPGDTVARAWGIEGPAQSLATACAAATMALEAAWLALCCGEVDVAVVGGSDGLCHLTYAGFNALRAVSERPCEPFRAERDGLSLGEGAAVLVLERPGQPNARGARPLASVLAVSSSCDAHHMTAPHPEGRGLVHALGRALALADVPPASVSFVNAHGTGTPHNDAAEAAAFRQVFGDALGRLPVTSTKGAIGHLLGSAGAVEALVTVCCLEAGRVHPTPGAPASDPDLGVDLVRREARPVPGASVAVSTNLAFGGANAVAVFGRVRPGAAAASPSGGAA